MNTHRQRSVIGSFTASLAEVEAQFVSSLFGIYPASIEMARQEGMSPELVIADDLRHIYVAVLTAAQLGHDEAHAIWLAEQGLKHFEEWNAWSRESLIDFTTWHKRETPIVRELAQAIVAIHQQWADAAEASGPMYCAPPALGQLNEIRIGLILVRLAKLSGIPLVWIHERFSEICLREDAKITFTPPAPEPIKRTPILTIVNGVTRVAS